MGRTLVGQWRRAKVGPARPVRTHVDKGSRGCGRKPAFKLHDQGREGMNEFDLQGPPKAEECRTDQLGGLV